MANTRKQIISNTFFIITLFFLLSITFVLLFTSLLAHAENESLNKKNILVIESYHEEYLWSSSYRQEIEKAFSSDYRIECFRMDTKRIAPEKHKIMADLAWEKYNEIKPALVFLGDDAALKFLGPLLAKTDTPVVYLGINNNPREYIDVLRAKNITGVLERPLMKAGFNVIKSIYPEAKKIMILFDKDLTSQVVLKEIFGGKENSIIEGLNADFKLIGSLEEWKKDVLGSASKYDAIVAGLYHTLKDESGNNVDSEEVIRWTSANTPLPLFGFWEFSIGYDKAMGGLVISGAEQGKAAVEIARKILSGIPPDKIYPVTAEKGRFLFSKKQLEKNKIILPEFLKMRADFVE